MKRRAHRLVALLLGAGAGVPAALGAPANTDFGNVAVSVTVPSSCVIASAPLAFGRYDAVAANAAAPLDGLGTLTIGCTGGTAWTVGLGNGQNYAGGRRMRSGASFLAYDLYSDAGRSSRWGDGTSEPAVSGALAATGYLPVTIYGRVPPAQGAPAGSYSDVVTATISF